MGKLSTVTMWEWDLPFSSNRLRGSFDYFIKTNNGMFIDVHILLF